MKNIYCHYSIAYLSIDDLKVIKGVIKIPVWKCMRKSTKILGSVCHGSRILLNLTTI